MVVQNSAVKFTEQSNGEHLLELHQGKTLSFTIVWGGATPIDVTGFGAKMEIRKTHSTASAHASFTTGNSRVTIGTTDGQITFTMSAADSANLTPGRYVYDIEVTDGSSVVHMVARGYCDIIAEATK
jgi:hypothetical protein